MFVSRVYIKKQRIYFLILKIYQICSSTILKKLRIYVTICVSTKFTVAYIEKILYTFVNGIYQNKKSTP